MPAVGQAPFSLNGLPAVFRPCGVRMDRQTSPGDLSGDESVLRGNDVVDEGGCLCSQVDQPPGRALLRRHVLRADRNRGDAPWPPLLDLHLSPVQRLLNKRTRSAGPREWTVSALRGACVAISEEQLGLRARLTRASVPHTPCAAWDSNPQSTRFELVSFAS